MALYQGLGDNYLGLTESDLELGGDSDAVDALNTLENYLKSFKSLDCAVCNIHFGYQHRLDPNVKLCSATCMAVANAKLNNERELSSAFSTLRRAVSSRETIAGAARSICTSVDKRQHGGKIDPVSASTNMRESVSEEVRGKEVSAGGTNAPKPVNGTDIQKASAFKDLDCDEEQVGDDVTDALSRSISEAMLPMMKSHSPKKSSISSPVVEQVKKEQILIDAAKIVKNGHATPVKDIVIEKQEKPVSVPEELVAQKLVRPKLVAAAQPKKKIWTLKDMTPSLGLYNNQKVIVRYWWSTPTFTISAVSDNEKVDMMQAAIAEYVVKAPPIQRNLSVSDIVFARYDGDFYRGCVEEWIAEEGKYRIRFLDYGDQSKLPPVEIVEPSDEIMNKNDLYGLVFTLTLNRNDYPTLTALKNQEFISLVEKEEFSLKVDDDVDKKSSNWHGFLYTKDGRSLNELLEKITAERSVPEKEIKKRPTPDLKEAVVKTQVTTESEVPPNLPNLSINLIEKSDTGDTNDQVSPPKKSFLKVNPFLAPVKAPVKLSKKNLQYSEYLKNEATVMIGFIWSSSQVTVNAEDDAANMAKLASAIDECVKTGQKLSKCPEVNDYILVEYYETFYRARVDKVENDTLQVSFVDYGDIKSVDYKNCYEVNNEVMEFPIFGRVVKLAGIPENAPEAVSDDLEAAVTNPFVMHVESATRGIWSVVLHLSDSRTYNDLVSQALSK